MRNWAALVRERMAALGLDPEREEEIRAELAGHLEDEYLAARRRGCSEEQAVAQALERVPDWAGLARTIRAAAQKDGAMSKDARTVLLPGMAASCGPILLFALARLIPPAFWSIGMRASVLILLTVPYLGFGALGASWSRRAGGRRVQRFWAGMLPIALHLAIVIPAIIIAQFAESRLHPEQRQFDFELGVLFGFVLVPAVALAIGTLPFLPNRESARALAR